MALLGELLGVADIDGSIMSMKFHEHCANTNGQERSQQPELFSDFCRQDCGRAGVKGHGNRHEFILILSIAICILIRY